ncbi:MAG: energy transducer TonB [Lysobacter sp.]|nr:MAG: energy transducer TonB [Lysobacter sp.]
MNQFPNVRRAARAPFVLAVAMGLVLAGCGKDEAPATANPQAAKPAATPQTVISEKVSALAPDALRAAATKAYNENRLYAPAGDNAIEYYLALRDKVPGDAAVSSALVDLLPMAVIATEQSVARDDFTEAQRLSALIGKADPSHPALARLKGAIAAQQQAAAQRAVQQQLSAEDQAKKQVELEKKRIEDQKKQQELAAKQLATKEVTDRAAADRAAADRAAADRAAADRAAADRAAADRAAAAQRQAAERPAATTTPARPAAAAAGSGSSELRALSTPAPEFPPEALRAAQSGEVQVEFTVSPDGSVSAARVVRANPPRVFDRAAVNAVKRWRFAPVDAPVTARRTIAFNPGN